MTSTVRRQRKVAVKDPFKEPVRASHIPFEFVANDESDDEDDD